MEQAPGDHGFTLLEVLVATMLAMTVVVGVGVLSVVSTKAVGAARAATFLGILASQKVEELRASGAETHGSGGSLDDDEAGFVDFLDMDGRMVGRDARPPDAVYVRRWSVETRDGSSGPSAIVRVLTMVVADVARSADRRRLPRGAGGVLLVTAIAGDRS